MNIFVAKLNFDTRESELQQLFEEYGEVSSVKIITDKFTGKSKGFGFVEMPNDDEANNAINDLDETELDGRTILVKKARPKEEGGDSRGGDSRGGGGWGDRGDRGDRGGYNRGGGGGHRRY